MARTFLVPYMVFVGAYLLLNFRNWSAGYFKDMIIKYLLGMSFSKRLLTDIPSVGPVYFILLLFAVRLIYMICDRICRNNKELAVLTIIISLAGAELGNKGFWLPWSIDVAMYCLVFYYIGVLFKQYGILKKIRERKILYFVFASIWAYMIYAGSMEISIRNYGSYGLVILGSVSGVLVVMQLAYFIEEKQPALSKLFSLLGEFTLYILIITVLLGNRIGEIVGQTFTPGCFPYMCISVLIQIVLAVAIGICIDIFKGKSRRVRSVQQR